MELSLIPWMVLLVGTAFFRLKITRWVSWKISLRKADYDLSRYDSSVVMQLFIPSVSLKFPLRSKFEGAICHTKMKISIPFLQSSDL